MPGPEKGNWFRTGLDAHSIATGPGAMQWVQIPAPKMKSWKNLRAGLPIGSRLVESAEIFDI